ncbi:hypothetical protein [Leifsonia shinshuensis]|uniref:Lipoprotein n=1 Tax=Leifsonia shinshuensis TaxID=150026 RepID=A0A853D578_9MICO|nr:hypothetical protein [Leifsonia shinshuensis]NYJ25785.1 hypothetical protein [Leifsonia shinshuensis]
MSASRTIVIAFIACAGAAGLTACSTAAHSIDVDFSKRTVISGQAKLDEGTDSAVLPLDRYMPSDAEDRTVDYAIDLSLRSCMAGKGFDFKVIDRRQGHSTVGFRLFGVWVLNKAAQYGYNPPPPDQVTQQLQALNAQTTTPDSQAAYSACLDAAAKKFPRVDPVSTLAAQGAATAFDKTIHDDSAGKKIVADWRSCMSGHGIALAKDGLNVDVSNVNDEQKTKIAVQDVECKTATNAVQRLADIDASYQTAIVNQKQAALNDERTKIDKTLAAAQTYIDQNG